MSYQLAAREGDGFAEAGLTDRDDAFAAIVGRSAAIGEALKAARRVAARGGTNVLLVGEAGTGKQLFARAVHYAGPAPESPFLSVDCAAFPGHLLEYELFGYERGGFTGAKQKKMGLLELARDGTLFLEEVSSLPMDLQPKLLRAIEERRVRRVGGIDEIEIHCRIVASTNEAIGELVAEGAFREDLFYRLNVLPIHLPPLRARAGDVILLAEHFLVDLAVARGLPPARLSPGARAALEAHEWPGNVRELKNVIERALGMSDGREIGTEHLLLDRRRRQPAEPAAPSSEAPDAPVLTIAVPPEGRSLRSVEAELVRLTLGITEGNKSAAARILGISRPTLHKKVPKRRSPVRGRGERES